MPLVCLYHYSDVSLSAMASGITAVSIVYSIVCSGANQRKHQSSASLAFVWGIQWWPANSPQKRPSNAENISIWWRHHDTDVRLCSGPLYLFLTGHRTLLKYASSLYLQKYVSFTVHCDDLFDIECHSDTSRTQRTAFTKHIWSDFREKYDYGNDLDFWWLLLFIWKEVETNNGPVKCSASWVEKFKFWLYYIPP